MSRPKSPGRPVTASLEVTSIAPGGFGVAHVEHGGERRAVFVPHAAKGDRLLAEVSFGSRPAQAGQPRRISEPLNRMMVR